MSIQPPTSSRDLTLLPKALLHAHLEGSMRPATLVALLQRQRLTAPATRYMLSTSTADVRALATVVVCDEQALRRVVHEMVQDAACDGAIWVEPQVNPQAYVPRLGSVEHVLAIVLDQGRLSAEKCGIAFGLTVAASACQAPEEVERLAGIAVSLGPEGVKGFGLTRGERPASSKNYSSAFTIARQGGLVSAPHLDGRAGPQGMHAAIDHLYANRLFCGVGDLKSLTHMDRLAKGSVSLDVCLASGVQVSHADPSSGHTLRRFLEAGVPCSISSEDLLLSGGGILKTYTTARTMLALEDESLAQLARNAIAHASGLPSDLACYALARIDAWLSDVPQVVT